MSDSQQKSKPTKQQLPCLAYALGGASFLPLLGVPLGIVTIIWGLLGIRRGGWKLMLLGTGGILSTIVLYGSLVYFGTLQRGGVYDQLRVQMAERQLVDLVHEIEYYKSIYGIYPASLQELRASSTKPIFIYDPVVSVLPAERTVTRLYFYQLVDGDEHYYLFSIGIDGHPFTQDDILPQLLADELKKVGYRERPQP